MAVTAKFRVNRKSDMGWGTELELTPDYAHGRNAEWAAATPSGMCRMTINTEKTDAAGEFEENKPVTIIFVTNPDGEVTDQDIKSILLDHNAGVQAAWTAEREGKIEEAIAAHQKAIAELESKRTE